MARWTDGYFAVWYVIGGARNGRRYLSMLDAQAHYARLVAMPVVS